MANNKRKKRKIKYKNLIFLIFIIGLVFFCFYAIFNINVKNIYVKGNELLTDQQVIDAAGLKNYPKIMSVNKKKLKSKIEDDVYINSAKIKFKKFRQEITIEVTENKPILFYEYDHTYLLSDGSEVSDKYVVPTLINQTPDTILKKLLTKLNSLDDDVLERISEIRYYPSNVDEELFYLIMNDGNYVYINFNSFNKLNNYIDILKAFDNKKGTLHLDSGDYLELFDSKNKSDK